MKLWHGLLAVGACALALCVCSPRAEMKPGPSVNLGAAIPEGGKLRQWAWVEVAPPTWRDQLGGWDGH